MKLPVLRGTIDRRILVNFRVDPQVLAGVVPAPFRPQIVGGYGMAGICLIRLKGIRPRFWPARGGLSSENAAHRIAVERDERGRTRQGVYVPRRDSSSWWNALVGGRIFPGVHHHARFRVVETDDRYQVELAHADGTHLAIDARRTERLPGGSIFESLAHASEFFAAGSLGWSATPRPGVFDALELRTLRWEMQPLDVSRVESSFFSDRQRFPPGSVEFDSALLMRNIEHEWHSRDCVCSAPPVSDRGLAQEPGCAPDARLRATPECGRRLV